MPTARLVSRRRFAAAITALPVALGVRRTRANEAAQDSAADGLSHAAAAIHQEISFDAASARVYAVLTSTQQFDALTRLSDAATLLTAPGAKATAISPNVGGPFTLFGGYVTGRHLEMVPGKRLVQAWRAGGWESGSFSVVRFVLQPEGRGCRLIFDHRGFPDAQGSSLAYGWRVHYWEPLAKLLHQR
jgi:activator of HSP90 ATPase